MKNHAIICDEIHFAVEVKGKTVIRATFTETWETEKVEKHKEGKDRLLRKVPVPESRKTTTTVTMDGGSIYAKAASAKMKADGRRAEKIERRSKRLTA